MQKPGSVGRFSPGPVRVGDLNSGKLTVEHDGGGLGNTPDVARLLPELTDGGVLGGLALVDQPRGHLNAHLVHGRAVLLLEDDLRARGGPSLHDGQDAHPVDVAALRPRPPLRRLPDPLLPVRVAVFDPSCHGMPSGQLFILCSWSIGPVVGVCVLD